jgi:hypothetical protein
MYQQNDQIQLQQYMPNNMMLPPISGLMPSPAIAQSINKTAQAAQIVDRQVGRFFRIAILSTILFFILSYSATYRVMNHLYYLVTNNQHQIIGENGFITVKGSFVHSAIFFVLMLYVVYR